MGMGGGQTEDKEKKDDRRRNSMAFNIKRFNDWEEDEFTDLVEEIRGHLAEGGVGACPYVYFSLSFSLSAPLISYLHLSPITYHLSPITYQHPLTSTLLAPSPHRLILIHFSEKGKDHKIQSYGRKRHERKQPRTEEPSSELSNHQSKIPQSTQRQCATAFDMFRRVFRDV